MAAWAVLAWGSRLPDSGPGVHRQWAQHSIKSSGMVLSRSIKAAFSWPHEGVFVFIYQCESYGVSLLVLWACRYSMSTFNSYSPHKDWEWECFCSWSELEVCGGLLYNLAWSKLQSYGVWSCSFVLCRAVVVSLWHLTKTDLRTYVQNNQFWVRTSKKWFSQGWDTFCNTKFGTPSLKECLICTAHIYRNIYGTECTKGQRRTQMSGCGCYWAVQYYRVSRLNYFYWNACSFYRLI